MKNVDTLKEFILNNDRDLHNILIKCFRKFVMESDGIDDIKQDLYLNFLRNSTVEKFDPSKGTFSNYIFKCVKNYLIAYKSRYIEKYKFSFNKLDFSFDDASQEEALSSYLEIPGDDVLNKIFLKQVHNYLICSTLRNVKIQLHQVFKGFLEGKLDKDISEETGMTVAGIGCIKRKIRKEILALS